MGKGRPPFKIEPRRLRGLREEKGMTQRELGHAAASVKGTTKSDPSNLVRTYQRIENTGRTSRKMAQALAQVLDVSVHVLQGLEEPGPPEYLGYLQKLLDQQLRTGQSPRLQHKLDKLAKNHPDQALEFLTEDVAERIEAAQLVRNPTIIAELAELTGLPESILMAPAHVQGHWFIATTLHGATSTQITTSSAHAGAVVGELMREHLQRTQDDTVVRMWRDKPWYRIEIEHPRIRLVVRIDFTRCQPDAKGLKWIDGSWRDDWALEFHINQAAFEHADFVTFFTGKTLPADLNRLCLVVTESYGPYGKPVRRMIIRRCFDEIPVIHRQSWADSHQRKLFMADTLRMPLCRALMPHLASRPAGTWRVTGDRYEAVDLRITTPRDNLGLSAENPCYRISLREETAPDHFEVIPVRASYYAHLATDINEWLAKGDWAKYDDEPLPDFEPIVESESE